MFVIIGSIIVLASLLGGFIIAGGNPISLVHISEIIIIVGIGVGSVVIANPLHMIMKIIGEMLGLLKGPSVKKQDYLDMMMMLYELFQFAKREGLIALEPHIEAPETSQIISKYPSFLKNHHAVEFLTDTLKVILSGGIPAHDLEDLMDLDLDGHHEEEHNITSALTTLADAFPGVGIIAAVLGIIVTMGAINEGAEAIGEKVAAALTGTFLGILLSYGFLGPMVKNMEMIHSLNGKFLLSLKAALLSFAKGAPAAVAVEYARRAIDPHNRPSFAESEEAMKATK